MPQTRMRPKKYDWKQERTVWLLVPAAWSSPTPNPRRQLPSVASTEAAAAGITSFARKRLLEELLARREVSLRVPSRSQRPRGHRSNMHHPSPANTSLGGPEPADSRARKAQLRGTGSSCGRGRSGGLARKTC